MTIHVLVEGSSELALLSRWLPRLLKDINLSIHPYQGKGSLANAKQAKLDPRARGLLDQLPAALRGFYNSLKDDQDAILILLDADKDDPQILKAEVLKIVNQHAPDMKVKVCLAIEETEAFYLGDLRALERAYPDADMDAARAYVPDSICDTWELFDVIVNDGGGNKVAWAEAIGPYLTIRKSQSRSPSFKNLLNEFVSLIPRPAPAKKKRVYRHKSKTAKREN